MNKTLEAFLNNICVDSRIYSEIRIPRRKFVLLAQPCVGCIGVLKPGSSWHKSNMFSSYFMDREYVGRYPDPYKSNIVAALEQQTMTVQTIEHTKRKFTVVRDDLLLGGTKSRGLVCYLRKLFDTKTYTEVVYAGPSNGAAQVALGVAAGQLHVKATVFSDAQITPLYEKALSIGVEFHKFAEPLSALQTRATKYCQNNTSALLLPFGLDDEVFKTCMAATLLAVNIIDLKTQQPFLQRPARMWLVAGSATLLNCLYHVFPATFFCVVQVGKKIWWDQIDATRTRIFISPHTFNTRATILPPYPSVATYDAKVWEFVVKYGESGDWIWNVAAD